MNKPSSSNEEQEYTAKLWADYKKNPTPRLRAILAEKYTPLVHRIAGTFAYKKPSVLDYDDLVQAGSVGLLDAIEKFNPDNEKKAQFQTYATFRVRGAILDEINSLDWTPRSVRQNIKGVIESIQTHYDKTQEEPSVNDIATHANLDRETTRKILGQMDKTYILHVENEIIDVVGPTTNQEQAELSSMINVALTKVLTEMERAFIVLKYFMGYTNREIQDTLDLKVSEMKNVRDSAIEKLSKELEDPNH